MTTLGTTLAFPLVLTHFPPEYSQLKEPFTKNIHSVALFQCVLTVCSPCPRLFEFLSHTFVKFDRKILSTEMCRNIVNNSTYECYFNLILITEFSCDKWCSETLQLLLVQLVVTRNSGMLKPYHLKRQISKNRKIKLEVLINRYWSNNSY